MAYINREETIDQIKEIQSLYTGQLYDLIGRALDVVKSAHIATVDELYKQAYEKGKADGMKEVLNCFSGR